MAESLHANQLPGVAEERAGLRVGAVVLQHDAHDVAADHVERVDGIRLIVDREARVLAVPLRPADHRVRVGLVRFQILAGLERALLHDGDLVPRVALLANQVLICKYILEEEVVELIAPVLERSLGLLGALHRQVELVVGAVDAALLVLLQLGLGQFRKARHHRRRGERERHGVVGTQGSTLLPEGDHLVRRGVRLLVETRALVGWCLNEISNRRLPGPTLQHLLFLGYS